MDFNMLLSVADVDVNVNRQNCDHTQQHITTWTASAAINPHKPVFL